MKTFAGSFLVFILFALVLNLSHANSAHAAALQVSCDVAELIVAINTANSTPEADTLELAADCVYELTAVDNADEVQGGSGLPVIATEITIHGNNATIQRSGANAIPYFRLLRVASTGILTLIDLTLARGELSTASIFNPNDGAGILNQGGTVTLENVRMISNYVWSVEGDYVQVGGAIYNAEGQLHVVSGRFNGNGAAQGGAIVNSDTLVIENSTFLNNFGEVYGAGAIYNSGNAQISNSTFRKNFSYGVEAGGSAITNIGTITIVSSTFYKNNAQLGYGGVIENRGEARIANSTIAANRGTRRGGIYNVGALYLKNVTLARNTPENLTTVALPNAETFAANTIFLSGGENCIGPVQDRGGNVRFPAHDKSCAGKFGDPKLGALTKNGGVTKTLALLTGSAAIHAGSVKICRAPLVKNHDQRGIKRVHKGETNCDSGAYEVE